MNKKIVIIVQLAFSATAYAGSDSKKYEEKFYTLYRDSAIIENSRIHFATFNSNESESFNKRNCEDTAVLINNLPDLGISNLGAKYWCEKGYFRE